MRLNLAGAQLTSRLIESLNRAQIAYSRTTEGRSWMQQQVRTKCFLEYQDLKTYRAFKTRCLLLSAQGVAEPFVFTDAHVDIVRDIKEKRLGVLPEADADIPRATAADVSVS